MKKYLFLIVVMAFAAQDLPKQSAPKNGPIITFEKKTHDFGDIFQGDKVEETSSSQTREPSL